MCIYYYNLLARETEHIEVSILSYTDISNIG
jgi:hypothetical protein